MNSSSVCMAATAVDIPGSSTIHFLKNCTAAVRHKNEQQLRKTVFFILEKSKL